MKRSWSIVPLGDVCTETNERNGKRNLEVMSVSKNLGVLPQAERFRKRIASADTTRYKVIHPGDFVFDPMLLWTGSISRFTGKSEGIVSPAYCTFRADNKKINPAFLHYFLKLPEHIQFYKNISFGTNQRRQKARFQDFAKFSIPLPPLAEQERIVYLLDEAESLRKLRTQASTRMEEFVPALFHEMFWEDKKKESGRAKISFGEFTIIDAKMVDPRKPEYCDLIHIGPEHIEKETGKLLPARTAREDKLISSNYLFDESHVLYSKIRPYLKKAALPNFSGLCSADMYPIKPDESKINREFLWAMLLSKDFSDYAISVSGRANMPKINRGQLSAYQTFLPPLAFQREFAQRVQEAREIEARQARSAERIEALYQSMLSRAFAGEL